MVEPPSRRESLTPACNGLATLAAQALTDAEASFPERINANKAKRGEHQSGLACLIDTMHGKDGLCQVDSYGYDSPDFPSQVS